MSKHRGSFGYVDASVHRVISDIAAFIGHENSGTHRILASGDLNIYHGYGDGATRTGRHVTVQCSRGWQQLGWNSSAAGTEWPANGDTHYGPTRDLRNVVTYCLLGRRPETTSNNQLDYAFASRGFHEAVPFAFGVRPI